MHSKGNHQKNKKTTYEMGENIFRDITNKKLISISIYIYICLYLCLSISIYFLTKTKIMKKKSAVIESKQLVSRT